MCECLGLVGLWWDDYSSPTWSLILTLKPSPSPNANPNHNPTYPTNPNTKTWP